MLNDTNQIAPPSRAHLKGEKNIERRIPPPNRKTPELILWVMITMLLVKFAVVLFGGGK